MEKIKRIIKLLCFSFLYWGTCAIIMIVIDSVFGINKYYAWAFGAFMASVYWKIVDDDIF